MIAKSQLDSASQDKGPSSPTGNKEKVIEVDENCAAIEQVESYSEKVSKQLARSSISPKNPSMF
mgnify:CR=1 FL=1